jgi:hypothetical protein
VWFGLPLILAAGPLRVWAALPMVRELREAFGA